MSEIKLAGITDDSVVDGPGLRLTIFTQGCPHHCPGCHNPETHDPTAGHAYKLDDVLARMRVNPLLSGITLSGGEPFMQAEACATLAEAARQMGLSVWTYTGYTYEALAASGDESTACLLRATDVLVDGPFVLSERSLELLFRGSRNQRLIDVSASLAQGQAIIWQPPQW